MNKTPSETTPIFQYGLWWLLILPLLVSPLFLGVEIQRRLAVNVRDLRMIAYIIAVVVAYVVACCWIAIRSIDPLNDFRRFPFRGSLLVGAIAGAAFGLQFAIGFSAASLMQGQEDALTILAMSVPMSLGFAAWGILGGAYLGMMAGASYCIARKFLPRFSNRAAARKRMMAKYRE